VCACCEDCGICGLRFALFKRRHKGGPDLPLPSGQWSRSRPENAHWFSTLATITKRAPSLPALWRQAFRWFCFRPCLDARASSLPLSSPRRAAASRARVASVSGCCARCVGRFVTSRPNSATPRSLAPPPPGTRVRPCAAQSRITRLRIPVRPVRGGRGGLGLARGAPVRVVERNSSPWASRPCSSSSPSSRLAWACWAPARSAPSCARARIARADPQGLRACRACAHLVTTQCAEGGTAIPRVCGSGIWGGGWPVLQARDTSSWSVPRVPSARSSTAPSSKRCCNPSLVGPRLPLPPTPRHDHRGRAGHAAAVRLCGAPLDTARAARRTRAAAGRWQAVMRGGGDVAREAGASGPPAWPFLSACCLPGSGHSPVSPTSTPTRLSVTRSASSRSREARCLHCAAGVPPSQEARAFWGALLSWRISGHSSRSLCFDYVQDRTRPRS